MKNSSAKKAFNVSWCSYTSFYSLVNPWRQFRIWLVLVGFGGAVFLLHNFTSYSYFSHHGHGHGYGSESSAAVTITHSALESVLKSAAMEDRTVILTTLNEAWARPGSVFDLFLESFKIGNGTQRFLKHLVVINFDQNAYARCVALQLHCYELETQGINFTNEATFRSSNYLEIVWRKIELLADVLDLGYTFVFTDSDIMWLQDPFKHFYSDADFQVACDHFYGNSSDLGNAPNTGFIYVKSNSKTKRFYRFWYESRVKFPGHDQDVFDEIIKSSGFLERVGLQIRFLDTNYYGGFCEAGHDLNLITTMHANCCVGLKRKVGDLKIVLSDWRKFLTNNYLSSSWTAPRGCWTATALYNVSHTTPTHQ